MAGGSSLGCRESRVKWHFLPEHDKRQRVRIQRLLLAAATSAAAVVLALVVALAGYLSYPAVARFAVIVVIFVAGFYGLIRSGSNLRFAEPSLTAPQMIAAGLGISYMVLEADAVARPAFTALYFIAFMFGVLALDTKRLLGVALFYLACYAAVVVLSLRLHSDVSPSREAFRIGIFALVLGGFSLTGGYISRLHGKLKAANARLTTALHESESLARVDGLTGCYNRRHGLQLLDVECKRAARGDRLTICLADLDNFKAINDKFGHAAGDEVLKAFSRTVQSALRATDALARYGGEEFLIVLSQTSIAEAKAVADRIRRLVEGMTAAALPKGERVTVSIGVAEHEAPDPAERTIRRADAALYQAKEHGRNRIVYTPHEAVRYR
jgi:diguanylate cyclase